MLNFYTGRDNEGYARLFKNNVEIDYAVLTRMQVQVADQEFDNVADPEVVQVLADRVVLALGKAGIAPGSYRARLVVYAGDHPDGIVWGDPLSVRVN